MKTVNRNDVNEQVVRFVSEQLQIEDVKVYDRLYDMGADSLSLTELALWLEETFNLDIVDDGSWNDRLGRMTIKEIVSRVCKAYRDGKSE